MTRNLTRKAAAAALTAVAVAAASFVTATPARAETATYIVDPEHTMVTFSIKHLFSKVRGQFTKFEGTLQLDEGDLSTGSVKFTIDAASIDTNEEQRDNHLRSDAFFDVAKHPEITFVSNGVHVKSPDKITVRGDLTIRGVTKSVLLDVDVLGFGTAFGVRRAGFEATTRIDRLDYGVSWNTTVEGGGFLVGNDVDITLNLEAKREKAKNPEAGTGSN